jgi:hypothetical protein
MSQTFPCDYAQQDFPSKSMDACAPDYFRRPSASGEKTTIVEFNLRRSGLKRYSYEGVRTRRGYASATVLSISPITREIGIRGDYRVSDCTIRLRNFSEIQYADASGGSGTTQYREWSYLAGYDILRGSPVRVRFTSLNDPLDYAFTLFSGRIDSYEIGDGYIDIYCRDDSYERFEQLISVGLKQFTVGTFPDLPDGTTPDVVPVIYGFWGGYDATQLGAGNNLPIPCTLIDPAQAQAKYRYAVCQHAIAAGQTVTTDNVKNNGGAVVGTLPTLGTATYASVLMTVLDFDSDQGDGFITCAFNGMTNLGPTSGAGTLLALGGEVLMHFLTNYLPGMSQTDFDCWDLSKGNTQGRPTSSVAQANVDCPASVAMCLSGQAISYKDVINEYFNSVLVHLFTTRSNLYGMFAWSSTKISEIHLPTLAYDLAVSDEFDIVDGSYRSRPHSEDICTTLKYWNEYIPSDDRFNNSHSATDTSAIPYLFRTIQAEKFAKYADSSDLSQIWQYLLSNMNRWHEFELPISFYNELEIGKRLKLSHFDQPGAFALNPNQVLSSSFIFKIETDPNPTNLTIKVLLFHPRLSPNAV